ncbi:MAG: hypothetical protein V8Q32_08060 [Anaerotignum faecicola]
MSAKLENQYGTINIENEVIARIAGLQRLTATELSVWRQKM